MFDKAFLAPPLPFRHPAYALVKATSIISISVTNHTICPRIAASPATRQRAAGLNWSCIIKIGLRAAVPSHHYQNAISLPSARQIANRDLAYAFLAPVFPTSTKLLGCRGSSSDFVPRHQVERSRLCTTCLTLMVRGSRSAVMKYVLAAS